MKRPSWSHPDLFRCTQVVRGLAVNQRRRKARRFDPYQRSQNNMGAAEGCGDALQVSCLEGFDTPGLHQ